MNCNCTFPESAESREEEKKKKVTSSNFSQQKAEVVALFHNQHLNTHTQKKLNNTKET